jgi:hypothetical protein
MYKAINIRGTNGSGKSHLIRSFLAKYETGKIRAELPGDLLGIGGKVEAYRTLYRGAPVYTIGQYETKGGGCDLIPKQDMVCDLVRKYIKQGHVLFEGVVITTLYSRYFNLSQEVGGMIWAYLDTPLDKCIKRIERRGGKKPEDLVAIKGETRVESKYNVALRTKAKAIADGETVVDLHHKRSLADLCQVLDSII